MAEIAGSTASAARNPALQTHLGRHASYNACNDQILFYGKATPDRDNVVAGRGEPRSAPRAGGRFRAAAVGVGACPTTARVAVEDLLRRPTLRAGSGKLPAHRVSIRPSCPIAIWRARAAGRSRHERAVSAPHAAASRTIRSGTRTRSSISCTSSRSSTPTTTASATFAGLIAKLDYIAELGVNAIWLLPFYPSPRRDDGYDIADYRDVHPDYGTLADFRRFIDAAHARGHPRHHRAGHQPHLRPAPLVPARAPAPSRARRRATSTSGPTPTRSTPARASSSSTPRSRTGPGTRWPAPISGTASIRTSPTSTSTIPRVLRGGARRHALLARHRASTGCGSTPCPIWSSARAPTTRTCRRRTPS